MERIEKAKGIGTDRGANCREPDEEGEHRLLTTSSEVGSRERTEKAGRLERKGRSRKLLNQRNCPSRQSEVCVHNSCVGIDAQSKAGSSSLEYCLTLLFGKVPELWGPTGTIVAALTNHRAVRPRHTKLPTQRADLGPRKPGQGPKRSACWRRKRETAAAALETRAPRPGARSSPHFLSTPLSMKIIAGIFLLPFIISGFAPRARYGVNHVSEKVLQSQSRFNWSLLAPAELKDRYMGLQTKSMGRGNPHFTLEGHKFLIFGGSIHYFRVPKAYWRDRLLKLKACGFNTLTTYVPWNLHEPERGKFYFSGNLDLEAFIRMAAELGLWVILRPGPYICSEIDLGGLPSWLLQDPDLKLRTTNKDFVDAVDHYFDHLIPRVIPLQYHWGGPIIAVQVENEYGSYNKDKDYMPYVQQALLQRGIVELLLTSDNEKDVLKGYIKGVLATINMKTFSSDAFSLLNKVQSKKPIMIMEFWVGWFDTWGNQHLVRDAMEVEHTVLEFIKAEISFNAYMFHGGTNFGFMNGATYMGKHRGVVTSYDYDAILTEAGDYTEKYLKLRKLFGSILATPLPPLPDLVPKAVYPPVRPSLYLPLWDVLEYLNEPVKSNIPINMENLPINDGNGQSYGFVLYETSICSGGRLYIHAQDMAQVFLNETVIGILNDGIQNLDIPKFRGCQLLRILVENQGRVNYSWKIQEQRKGLTGLIGINSIPLKDFTIYSLEMKMNFFERLRSATWRPAPESYLGPAFYLGTLKAGPSPKDTFLRVLGWKYGFVFINGCNLGRYWHIGPQETLYLPGSWLHPEDNEMILFEKMMSGSDIQSMDKPKL
ncbi:beta-galactosidase-1-like protein 3 [Orycteropus afer afer]|uniref:Beta-galactosidase n=1 Tax=Orycteropus afer afer TaxID=1230840 RepID=A0A8B7AG00_ORYAF|nr:beta-galactosidase-1-like protein 3 [Orycteropus afer afer]